MAITGTPAALASTRTSPNRSGMVFRCSNARARANSSFFPCHAHRSYIKDVLIVEMGFDLLPEISFVLDNTSDDQTHSAQTSNLDGQMNTFIRVDPTKENQVITAAFLKRVQREINAVVDGRQVIEPCRSVGVTDRNEISVTILLIDGHDFG